MYAHDADGNITKTTDALGNSTHFEYDAMNRLTKVRLHRGSEELVTIYRYDRRGLVTEEINAARHGTIYVYDGNGNLIRKTDADGYVTEFSYDIRNLAERINHADGRTVSFAYNKNGVLVEMDDWNGGFLRCYWF